MVLALYCQARHVLAFEMALSLCRWLFSVNGIQADDDNSWLEAEEDWSDSYEAKYEIHFEDKAGLCLLGTPQNNHFNFPTLILSAVNHLSYLCAS